MKKYRIAIEETLRKVVEIEAETPGLAVCRAEDEYNEEKHVLSADNFAGADIALSTDDSTVMETLEDVDLRVGLFGCAAGTGTRTAAER